MLVGGASRLWLWDVWSLLNIWFSNRIELLLVSLEWSTITKELDGKGETRYREAIKSCYIHLIYVRFLVIDSFSSSSLNSLWSLKVDLFWLWFLVVKLRFLGEVKHWTKHSLFRLDPHHSLLLWFILLLSNPNPTINHRVKPSQIRAESHAALCRKKVDSGNCGKWIIYPNPFICNQISKNSQFFKLRSKSISESTSTSSVSSPISCLWLFSRSSLW